MSVAKRPAVKKTPKKAKAKVAKEPGGSVKPGASRKAPSKGPVAAPGKSGAKPAAKPAARPAAARKVASGAESEGGSALVVELRTLLGENGDAIRAKTQELFIAIMAGAEGEAMLGLVALAFKRAAELGSAEAWVDFGRCLWNGWGVDRDVEAALAAYERAADLGSDHAAYTLALAAWEREDWASAQRWAKLALKGGDPVGAVRYLLGRMAFHGHGTRKALARSYALFEEAAERGDSDAMYELFALGSTGQGTEKDEAKAVAWLRKAAERNQPRALFNLGAFHAMGSFGFAQDFDASATYYEAASEAGHGRASATLGVMYLSGQGVPRNETKAEEFFARANAQSFDVKGFLEGIE